MEVEKYGERPKTSIESSNAKATVWVTNGASYLTAFSTAKLPTAMSRPQLSVNRYACQNVFIRPVRTHWLANRTV
jgi:hypothetical protein